MTDTISMDDFRALANRVGLELTDDELAHLKPMYEHFLEPVARMNALDLGDEDLAVIFEPAWDPEV